MCKSNLRDSFGLELIDVLHKKEVSQESSWAPVLTFPCEDVNGIEETKSSPTKPVLVLICESFRFDAAKKNQIKQ